LGLINAILPAAALFAAIGFVVNRWWAAILPLVVWPLYYLRLNAEWWGGGVGEFWKGAFALITVVSLAGAALGIMSRRIVQRVRHKRAHGVPGRASR
jgi:hypothetical protein